MSTEARIHTCSAAHSHSAKEKGDEGDAVDDDELEEGEDNFEYKEYCLVEVSTRGAAQPAQGLQVQLEGL